MVLTNLESRSNLFEHEKCSFPSTCKKVIYSCDISKCSWRCLSFQINKLYLLVLQKPDFLFVNCCKMEKLVENGQPQLLTVSSQNITYLIPDKPIDVVGSSLLSLYTFGN